jgi:hypothetical protein
MAEPAGRLVDTLDLCGLAGPSWGAWRTIAKCLDGEGASLTPDERRAFEALTGRTRPPREKPAELFVIAGRRSGKSRFAGACGVRAASRQYPLAPGETAVVGMAAADRDQARVVLQYATAPFREEPALRPLVRPRSGWQALRDLVAREHRWGVDLVTGVSIEVRTSHFGKIRGRTFALAVADEAAFWAAEDGSNPASEVLGAIRPGLVTLGGQLVVISTPWAKSGPLYDAFTKHFGQDDDRVLVVKAPSQALNPCIPEAVVREALDRDETAARSEWLGEFRNDLESFISQEAIRRVVVPGRTELAPRLGEEGDYAGFLDAADGAGQDSFTAAVCHLEREEDEQGVAGRTLVVLDAVREIRPPFNPTPAAATIAAFLKSYGLTEVWGDRWARSWVAEAFARYGLALWPCPQTKSELYGNFLPLVTTVSVELLDHPRLLAQLHALERRPGASGRDSIDHGRATGHDDVINSVAGAAVMIQAASAAPEPRLVMLG